MSELTLEQAADFIGISADDLMMSRLRGLSPGKLGHARGGKVYFDREDLLPVRPLSRKEQLRAEAESWGLEFTAKTTIAELEAMIAEVVSLARSMPDWPDTEEE